MTTVGVYGPEEGRCKETQWFYKELQSEVSNINLNDYVIISGDLNDRIVNLSIPGMDRGTFGEGAVNNNGYELRQFVSFNESKVKNSFFQKKDIYKYTWFGRGYRSIICLLYTSTDH